MKRREFITLLAGATAWPFGGRQLDLSIDDRFIFRVALGRLSLSKTWLVALWRMLVNPSRAQPIRSPAAMNI